MSGSNSSQKLLLAIPQPCHVFDTPTIGCCEKCKSALVEVGKSSLVTYYCSSDCQDADWQRHERHCRLAEFRNMLYRAGSLLTVVFGATRRAAFDIPVKHVQEQRDSENRLIVWKKHIHGHKLTFPVPDEKFMTEDDEMQMLMWSAGSIATMRLYSLLEACIQGTYEELVEVNVALSEDRHRVLVRDYDGAPEPMGSHDVFRVRLRYDDVSYAVDPAIAQFREEHGVMEWNQYVAKLNVSSQSEKPGGWRAQMRRSEEKSKYDKVARGENVDTDGEGFRRLAQSYVTERMTFAIDDWLQKHETVLSYVLRMGRTDTFYHIANHIMREVERFMTYIELGGGILALHGRVCVSVDSKTEQNPIFYSGQRGVQLPAAMMVRLHKLWMPP